MAEKTEKRTKQSVRYSKGMLTRHCGVCAHFRKPKSCTEVAGDIEPNMWCTLFERATVKEKKNA